MIAQLTDWQYGWGLAGWTMVHFLWLGTLITIGGAFIRFSCRSLGPTIRYALSLVIFTTLAVLPVGIVIWLSANPPASRLDRTRLTESHHEPVGVRDRSQATLTPVAPLSKTPTLTTQTASQPVDLRNDKRLPPAEYFPGGIPLTMLAANGLHSLATYLPWLWLAGTPLTFGLLTTGLVGSERLRHGCQLNESGPAVDLCRQLCRSLRIGHQVSIAICGRIAQPVLIGIVRPLILLPPAALTGWSPEQLEMVLTHELAHVRRWDNLVNLGQRMVESLLFFHPAVWLVSGWVRHDREECCDAVVVTHTAAPHAYADLLVSIAATSPSGSTTSLAAASAMANHPLTGRIRRILKLEDEPMLVSPKTLVLATFTVVLVIAGAVWFPVEKTNATNAEAAITAVQGGTHEDANENQQPTETKTITVAMQGPVRPDDQQRILQHIRDQGYEAVVHKKKNEAGVVKHFLAITVPANMKARVVIESMMMPNRQVKYTYRVIDEDLPSKSPNSYPSTVYPGVPALVDATFPQPRKALLLPGDVLELDVVGTPPTQKSLRGEYKIESTGTLALGAEYGRIQVAEKTLLEAEMAILKHLKTTLKNPKVQLQKVDSLRPSLSPQPVSNAPHVFAREVPSTELNKLNLRYDDKTFEEWRMLWRTELKTERRTEAIQALAAFGRAGYGKEAIETIFDVAEQYNFNVLDSSPEGKLKEAVLNLLTTSASHLPEALWLPVLQARLQENFTQVKWLANQLLFQLHTTDPSIMQRLATLTRHEDSNIRSAALRGMCNSDPQRQNPLALNSFRRFLDSEDPKDIKNALSVFFHTSPFVPASALIQQFTPEIMASLLHQDESVRRMTRQLLRGMRSKDARSMVEPLIAIANDPFESNQQLAAVRALTVCGEDAEAAEPALMKLLHLDDKKMAVAAALAIDSIHGQLNNNEDWPNHTLVGTNLLIATVAKEHDAANFGEWQRSPAGQQQMAKYRQLYQQEYHTIFPQPAQGSLGGGGGGLGGGGGGGYF